MKSTLLMSSLANPRRTTLADLDDAGELVPQQVASPVDAVVELPRQTANPRRTVLATMPAS